MTGEKQINCAYCDNEELSKDTVGLNKKLIPLGIVKECKNHFFADDMDKPRNLHINKYDNIIYVEYMD